MISLPFLRYLIISYFKFQLIMSLRQVEFQKVPEKLKKIENNFEIIFYRLWSIKNSKSLGKPHPECE